MGKMFVSRFGVLHAIKTYNKGPLLTDKFDIFALQKHTKMDAVTMEALLRAGIALIFLLSQCVHKLLQPLLFQSTPPDVFV